MIRTYLIGRIGGNKLEEWHGGSAEENAVKFMRVNKTYQCEIQGVGVFQATAGGLAILT